MAHRLFTALSLASFLLCLAFAAIWLRSYHVADELTWKRPDGDRSAKTMAGLLTLSWDLGFASQKQGPHGLTHEQKSRSATGLSSWAAWDAIDPILLMCTEQGERQGYWQRGEFMWIKKDRPLSHTYMARAAAPMWSVTTVAALLPLMWTTVGVGSRLRGRAAQGLRLCRKCGYDLRATPRRCPECGTPACIPA